MLKIQNLKPFFDTGQDILTFSTKLLLLKKTENIASYKLISTWVYVSKLFNWELHWGTSNDSHLLGEWV